MSTKAHTGILFKHSPARSTPSSSCSIQGLIFVVDSNDRERIGEARDELEKMVRVLDWNGGSVGLPSPPLSFSPLSIQPVSFRIALRG